MVSARVGAIGDVGSFRTDPGHVVVGRQRPTPAPGAAAPTASRRRWAAAIRGYRDAGISTLQAKRTGDVTQRLDTLAQLFDVEPRVSREPISATRPRLDTAPSA